MAQLASARYNRDALMFMPNTGLLNIVNDVKKYVKSVYGGKSEQDKNLSAIQFRSKKFVPSNSLQAGI